MVMLIFVNLLSVLTVLQWLFSSLVVLLLSM